MSRGRFLFVSLSLATVLILAAGTLMAANQRQQDEGDDSLYKFLAIFSEAFSLVNRAYVDELEQNQLLAGAFEGTLDALDPFSYFVPPGTQPIYEKVARVGTRHSGLLVLKERGVAYIVAVEEGSPAAEAGVQSGRILSELQGQATRQMPLLGIYEILAGEVGTEIELETIDQTRGGMKEKSNFQLAEFPKAGIELSEERGVAVLRIPGFHPETTTDVETSLQALRAPTPPLPGLSEASKLVLDLRGVAGGDERAAYATAGLFVGGALGVLAGRDGEIEAFEGRTEPLFDGEIAILIDNGTQGAAEVMAQILHQSLDATLVGERSFGHCGRQALVSLSNGASIQITKAFFTGPNREPINKSLVPDLRVYADSGSPDDPGQDVVLDSALERLLEGEPEDEEQAQAA